MSYFKQSVVAVLAMIAIWHFFGPQITKGWKEDNQRKQYYAEVAEADKQMSQVPSYGDLMSGVKDYGEGVYYFPFTKSEFGKALAQFLRAHKDLKVSAIPGDEDNPAGKTDGYFVVFEPK